MQWPPWASRSGDKAPEERRKPVAWADSLNATDWQHYTEPRNIFSSVVLASAILLSLHIHRNYLRRVPAAPAIAPSWFRRRSLFGRVTSVGDGDNFHLFHTPGGRWTGWDWVRKVPAKRAELRSRTVAIRLAGIDAPEGAHFGRPAQPYAAEALQFLRGYILQRRVRAYIYRRDQYDRAVATVYVRRGFFRRNVSLVMLQEGLATVYEAKTGTEFGGMEEQFRAAEAKARRLKKGMWAQTSSEFESPRAYKRRVAGEESSTAAPLPANETTSAFFRFWRFWK